ncbi:MAG: 6-bladed beta-propeller, partial [Nitrososphaeraceae archaeon]
FKTLHDVAVDLSGKYVYTLEIGNNHLIQKFSADGQFITKWSYEGFEGAKSYRDPHQIAIDSLGNVYLPDKDDSKVLKFDSSGKYIIKWGTDGTGDSQFKTPHGVAIDTENNVYVTDMDNFRVQKFDSNGSFITKWGSEGLGDGQFSKVTPGIDVDTKGYVYIVNKEGANVQNLATMVCL